MLQDVSKLNVKSNEAVFDHHFVGLKLWDGHNPGETTRSILMQNIKTIHQLTSPKQYSEIYLYRYEISQHHTFFHHSVIKNEQGVRFM